MFKRIMQSIALAVFASCLYFAQPSENVVTENPVNEEIQIVEHAPSELPGIIKLDLNMVQSSIETEETEETESTEDEQVVEETEYLYFVEIQDGVITEESIHSVAAYIGQQYDISPELLCAIAWHESNYKVNATGASGDKGLCQIVEKWHGDRMQRLGVSDIYDPYGNVLVCADILSELRKDKYGYDMRYVLMAYNMGSYNATKIYETGRISQYAIDILEREEQNHEQ